jgi:tetratricopeptide (TPR) repeat protein
MNKFFIAAILGGLILGEGLGCGGGPGERKFQNGIREYERGSYVRAKTLFEKSINERPGSGANAAAYNYLGLAEWKLGQLQRAIDAFEYSRRLNPALVEPTYNLAAILYESGDLSRVTILLDEAALADPSDSRALEFLGSIYTRAGKWQEARRVLFGALARSPQSPRVLTALAMAEIHASGADKAIFYLMQALEKKTDYAPALFNLGVIYWQDMKDKAQAAAYFKKYIEVEGSNPHADYARRAVEDMTAVPTPLAATDVVSTVAVPYVERPVVPTSKMEAQPASGVELPSAPPPSAARILDNLLKSAKTEIEKGNVQTALNLCLEAAGKAERAGDVTLQENTLRGCVQLCFDQPRAHYALGRFLSDHGQYDAALKAFKQAIVLDPKFTMAQLALADAAVKTDEIDAALVAIKQAIQLEPNNPDTFWSLAVLYDQELQNSDKVAQAYRQFADRFPGDPRVIKAQERLTALAPPPVRHAPPARPVAPAPAPAPRPTAQPPAGALRLKPTVVRNTHAAVQAYNRGTLYQQQEDLDRAIYYYTRAVENDDTFATAFFNLGSVYWAKGEYATAKEAYLRAVRIQPNMIAARYNLALIGRELKEKSDALEQLHLLLKDHADYAPGHYLLGMLYADDPATVGLAKDQYKAFLELAPNDPAAPVVRNWIATH